MLVQTFLFPVENILLLMISFSRPMNKLPWFKPSGTDLPENTDSGLNEPISMSDAILKVQLKSVKQDDIQPRKIGMIKKNLVKSSLLVFCFRNCSDTFSENIFEISTVNNYSPL